MKREDSLSLLSHLTSFGVGSVGTSADTNSCDSAAVGHTLSIHLYPLLLLVWFFGQDIF